jgi:hypothetical protein
MKENAGEKEQKKEITDILQGKDILKCVLYRRLRWYGQVERKQNQKMSKQITTTLEEKVKDEDHVKEGWTRFKRA